MVAPRSTGVKVRLVALAAVVLGPAAAGCGVSPGATPGTTPSHGSQPAASLPSGGCTVTTSSPYSGAPAALGLDARGATAPVWSSRIGQPQAVEGDRSFGIADANNSGTACVVATDLASGQIQWATNPPADHPELLGVIADSTTVVAAVGNQFGQAPAMVSSAVTGLVAYDPATGTPRWAFDFPADSQAVPAVLAGGVVVVTEADGTVVGLDEGDGRQLWKDVAHEKCSDWLGPLTPGAVPVGPLSLSGTGQTVAVVGYGCLTTGGVKALNPMDGSTVWNWGVPEGWSLDTQMLTTVDTRSPTGEVAVVPISQVPPANAPPVTAADPTPVVPTVIDNRYDYSQTNDVVVLNSARGEPLWDLQGVAGQAVEAVGGASSLCILTDAGADCRAASNGALRWSMYWPGKGASGTYPALECIDLPAISQGCTISADGHLYVALATDAAPAYDNPETLPPRAGLFDLTELDMASGAQISRIPLPAYDDPDGIGVCLAGPPAVLQVTDGLALVSPQSGDVVEAFKIS